MTDKRPKGVEEAVTAFVNETRLKVRRIGNSLGVVLPRDVLAKLGVGEGDLLAVTETEGGVTLSARDDEAARQIAVARDLMRRYRHTLSVLAK